MSNIWLFIFNFASGALFLPTYWLPEGSALPA
jgi:hypothetical protein